MVEKLERVKAGLLAIGVVKDKVLDDRVKRIDAGGLVSRAVEAENFSGDKGASLLVYLPPGSPSPRLLLVGLGESPGLEEIRSAAASAVSKAIELKASSLAVSLPWGVSGSSSREFEEAALAAVMASYRFEEYKSEKKSVPSEVLLVSSEEVEDAQEAVLRGVKIGEAVNYARYLADMPPSDMNPEKFEEEARRLAESLGLGFKVFRRRELEEMGMGGILGVGKGSSVEPRLVVLEYRGGEGKPIAVVGKGVTFDAGGLQIKTHQGMGEMKYDKSGAAAVMGIIKAVAELGIPVNVVGLIPLAENLPSGSSYKPGDILRMYNKMTVEVGHTDAEGRLLLADAIAYAAKNYDPRFIVDLATLTGAVVVALGNHAAGLFTKDEKLAEEFIKASGSTGERLWRLPLWDEYYEQLKSDVADIKNVGGRWGGAITAAAFLSKFAGDKPWVHLDIAGTAWTQESGPRKPYYSKGATGFGVRLVLEVIRNIAKH